MKIKLLKKPVNFTKSLATRGFYGSPNILNAAVSGKIEDLKLKIADNVYTKLAGLNVEVYKTKEPVSFEEKMTGDHTKLAVGQSWGGLFDCAWFHFTGNVPSSAKGKKVLLFVDVSGEGLIVDELGNPVRGITFKASSPNFRMGTQGKCQVPVADCSTGEEVIDVWMDAGCNDLFGNLVDGGRLAVADIVYENTELKNLYFDIEVLTSLSDGVLKDKNRKYSDELMKALSGAMKVLTDFSSENVLEARRILKPYLDAKNPEGTMQATSIGHAHIDLAWLWPERESYRKGARTFATQLQLIDEFEDYKFGASQAQLYKWMKDKYPALYARVKQAVADGRWEVQGAMWVEPDSNLLGGESLVRQILYGKAFFKEEFGLNMDIMWVPDSFGYSGALPQILKKSNIPYFMTQKMSWNKINKFPLHTFTWKGIDGSEVLTHMLPDNTYNSTLEPNRLIWAKNNFKQKDVSNEYLMLFGIGDGGGGPGLEHCEREKRCMDLKGMPKIKSQFAIDFFRSIEKNKANYPVHNGELYLEKHQGTYTTQANNKKNNRKIELALRECEYALSLSSSIAGFEYNSKTLLEIWQEVLLYHFHDILPGSSIKRVYDETTGRYKILLEDVKKITNAAYSAVLNTYHIGGTAVFNSLSFDRQDYIKHNDVWYRPIVKATGLALLSKANTVIYEEHIASARKLENEFIKVFFNTNGTVGSIFDKKRKMEYMEEGKQGNQFNLWKDMGDAWDIMPMRYYKYSLPEKAKLVDIKFINDGPCGKQIMKYQIGNSTIEQEVVLFADEKNVKFRTKVNFSETHKMLRVVFPVNIKSDKVKYNIQFGYIERATTHKDKIENAQVETSGQKWVDICDGAKGVTLVTDCKYGYRNWDNILDLNLLRSPMHPGKDADKGEHYFEYTIVPYAGAFEKADSFKHGYIHNIPMTVIETPQTNGKGTKELPPMLELDNDRIIFENIKRAEDNNGYVIRLFNSMANENSVKIKLNGFKAQNIVDLSEIALIELNGADEFSLVFNKFEILSIYVK